MARSSREGFLVAANRSVGKAIGYIKDEHVAVYAQTTKCHGYSWTREPLSTRTWTLQEELLASKNDTLYDRQNALEKCLFKTHCECAVLVALAVLLFTTTHPRPRSHPGTTIADSPSPIQFRTGGSQTGTISCLPSLAPP